MIPGIKQITKAIADAMTLSYWLASQNDWSFNLWSRTSRIIR
jgi:hypothetical protein